MMTGYSIAGTRAYAAVKLKHVFFGPFALVVYGLFQVPFAWFAFARGDVLPFGVSCVLLGFFLHVVLEFIIHELRRCDASFGNAGLLAPAIVHRIARINPVTAPDIVEAACASDSAQFILREAGIDPGSFTLVAMKAVEDASTPVFLDAAAHALTETGEPCIDAPAVLLWLFTNSPTCMEVLQKADVSPDDIRAIVRWERLHRTLTTKSVWSADWLRKSGSIGRSWVMGYTDALDALTTDLAEISNSGPERSVVIHRKEMEAMLHVLSRASQRNILLVGNVGTGRRRLTENFAHMLREQERSAHMAYTRLLKLNIQELLSGTANPDAFFLRALKRAQGSGRFLLVIHDMGMLLKSGSEQLRGVLQQFLQSNAVTVVGIVDAQEYHSFVKTQPAMDSLFEKITIENATDDETLSVLMARACTLEKRARVSISYKAMRAVMDLSRRYLSGKGGTPGTALAVLEDAAQRCLTTGSRMIREEHVRDAVSLKSNVNVRSVNDEEKGRLLNLEEALAKRVIGQRTALKAITGSLKRARLDIRERKKPIGTFLFLGPTGVGKTQTARALAEEYFGSPDAMVRLDMNEFGHPDSVFGIIGTSSGGGMRESFLVQRVQDKPFSLILLDEIEKAHPSVLNLFLQVLDEGFIADHTGRRTDFRNTIIIATSNAGALFIRDLVRDHPETTPDTFKTQLTDFILRERIFSPEFVNRFDDVVVFYPLSRDNARTVAGLMVQDIVNEMGSKRGVTVHVADDVLAALAERGYSIEFGAREMRRTVTEIIEDYLADWFLKHEVKRGDVIEVKKEDIRW